MTVGVLLNAPGEDARIEELEVDGPGPDEVQVRLEATGVCHSDLFVKESGGWGMPYPILLGHEGAGVVEEIGEGVERPSVGERVVLAWRSPCRRGDPRRCRTPLRARRRLRRKRDGAVVTQTLLCGTFATRTIVHAGAAIPVPPELPSEQACLLGCAVATGVGAVLQTSPAWPGSTVAVIGCGGVGLAAVQGARLAGAGRIVAVDIAARKLDWARTFGAADVVDASNEDAVSVVRALNNDEGVDFAYDAVGRGETLEQAVRMLAVGGTATLIGLPHAGASVTLALGGNEGLFMRRGTVRVSHGGDHLPAEDIPQLAQYALDGKLDLAAMVTRTIGLADVEQAFDDLKAGAVIRSVIQLPA